MPSNKKQPVADKTPQLSEISNEQQLDFLKLADALGQQLNDLNDVHFIDQANMQLKIAELKNRYVIDVNRL